MSNIFTKQEAIYLMKKGVKMTHAFFSHEEWVTIKNEDMLFEDGSSCSQNQFWADRGSREWLFNWSEWKELKQNDI